MVVGQRILSSPSLEARQLEAKTGDRRWHGDSLLPSRRNMARIMDRALLLLARLGPVVEPATAAAAAASSIGRYASADCCLLLA